jgi:hypothetical protein
LQVKRLLYTANGRPRLSIVSIAHLSESERMFFVTILLNEVLTWARSQSGTSSLRAILYMDEVFGYFPPIANPPSKRPMLTLLKQARAYGLGIVLATQNPVDLDYKGLSNAGTWFLGRLQTERDKARVLDGLEGAAATTGVELNRSKMEATLAGLGKRVFLLNNIHDDAPIVMQTRWALSYLRGPLTRRQIETLMAQRSAVDSPAPTGASGSGRPSPPEEGLASTPWPAVGPDRSDSGLAAGSRPIVPPEANECFLPVAGSRSEADRLVYRPALLGIAQLHFVRATYKVDVWETCVRLAVVDEPPQEQIWDGAGEVTADERDLLETPEEGIAFYPLPAAMSSADNYRAWSTRLKDYLYKNQTLSVWWCPELKQYSLPYESEDDFRIRLTQIAHEHRDLQVEKLRKKYASRLATLKDRIHRAQQKVDRQRDQYAQQQYQSAVSFGSTLVGALLGRKLISRTNVSRVGTAMRGLGRTAREREDVGRAEEGLAMLRQKLLDLEAELTSEVDEVRTQLDLDQLPLEPLQVRPRKSDLRVERVALVWQPRRLNGLA